MQIQITFKILKIYKAQRSVFLPESRITIFNLTETEKKREREQEQPCQESGVQKIQQSEKAMISVNRT